MFGAGSGAERAHPAVDPELLARRPVDDEDRAGRLGRDRDAVRVEGWVERGLSRRPHDREVGRTASREDGAGSDALERRLAVGRRHGAERECRVGAAEHRLDALGRRRYDGQTVAPAALEHVLELVEAPGRFVGPARPAAGLAERLLGRERRSQQPLVPLDVPADDEIGHAGAGLDAHGGRHGLDAVGPRDREGRRLREHGEPDAGPPRELGRAHGRLLCDADECGSVPVANRRQPPQRERRRGAIGVREHEHDGPLRGERLEREGLAVDPLEHERGSGGGQASSVCHAGSEPPARLPRGTL